MGNPEETVAAPDADATTMTEAVTEDLAGTLVGWKRKLSGKIARGTPGKKKDVSFVAPDGEEIKTKRQLDKYLKAHPGTLTASDFEWGGPAGEAVETPPENRRRSARLNSKSRTSTEGVDEETEPKQPVVKRSRKSRENGKDENDATAGKGEPISLDKEKENGEDSGETKAMDVDASKVEIPAAEETKEMTAETISEKCEGEKPVTTEPLITPLDTPAEPIDTPTEPSIKDAADLNVVNAPEGNGAVEKLPEEAVIPPPQGIHALVGEVPKSQGVEAAQEPEAVL